MHHLTHIDNLEKIIKKGILSRNKLNSKEYKDTADPSIIEKREELNNYVPFHINHLQIKYGVSYNHTVLENYGKANMIFLITQIPTKNLKEIIYCLYHPTSSYFREYNNFLEYRNKFMEEEGKLPKKEGFFGSMIDYSDNRCKQFFASEILIKDKVNIEGITSIYVFNKKIEKKVKNILRENHIETIEICIKPKFFR